MRFFHRDVTEPLTNGRAEDVVYFVLLMHYVNSRDMTNSHGVVTNVVVSHKIGRE